MSPNDEPAASRKAAEWNRIVLDDCRQILKRLRDDEVDLSIWSPPYPKTTERAATGPPARKRPRAAASRRRAAGGPLNTSEEQSDRESPCRRTKNRPPDCPGPSKGTVSTGDESSVATGEPTEPAQYAIHAG